MAPFGSSSDSNTIERGGLLTVLHIFFKKISDTLQIRTAEGDAAPKTGEGAQGRLQRIGAAPEPAAEGAAARKTVQRGGTARRAGRGKRQPSAADRATRWAGRRDGRGKRQPGAVDRTTRRDSTQGRQRQKTARRGRPCNAAGGTGRRAHAHRPSGQKSSKMSGQ